MSVYVCSEYKDIFYFQGGDFSSTQGLLSGTMKRFDYMVSTGKNNKRLKCYIILFLIGLFIVAYYLIPNLFGG